MNSDDEASDGEDGDGGEIQSDERVDEGDVGAQQQSDSEIPEYTCRPGCTQLPADGSPLNYFQMLVTDAMLDIIVSQTNLYATQYTHTLAPCSRVHQWSRQEFDRDELKKFVSLVLIMGLVNLPTIEDHWVTTWPYSSHTCSKV